MTIRLLKKDPCKEAYPDDDSLIQGISKNENQALSCMYSQTFAQIKEFITRNNGSEQDAEDVFQEALLAVWKNIKTGSYEKKQNVKLSTYLFQVSKFRWFAKLKSASVKYSTRLNPDFDVPEDSDLEEISEQAERVTYLNSLFDKLGDKCKKILNLYYYQKLSLATIAGQMGYTPKSVKNEKYRCMQRLKKLHSA